MSVPCQYRIASVVSVYTYPQCDRSRLSVLFKMATFEEEDLAVIAIIQDEEVRILDFGFMRCGRRETQKGSFQLIQRTNQ